MSSTVEIPSFLFSSFYFGDILDALVEYKRQNVPEHTDESAYDPMMQLLRMHALVGHLNNVLIDLVANENTLPTAKLVESVRNMLRLIDYRLSTASPAQADIIYELSKVFAASYDLIAAGALVATERQTEINSVFFERLLAVSIDRTDQFSYVYGLEGAAYTDYTAKANSPTTPGNDWTPWTGAVAAKDAIYFGHKHIMWDKLGLWFTTPMAGTAATGWIQFIVKANIVDGEVFKLADGASPLVTFHFDQTGTYTPAGGYDSLNIRVNISGDTTAAEVALTAKTAINAVGSGLTITGGGIVVAKLTLTNDVFGTEGNLGILETVVDAGFTKSGMSGGLNGIIGIWEYYDGDWSKANPTGVQKDIPAAGQLLFDLTGYLGSDDRTGTQIRVQLNETGAYLDLESAFGIPAGSGWGASRNYVVATTYLGQTSPSIIASDYTVGSNWNEFTDLVDGTEMLSKDGAVTFTLPQTLTEDWQTGTISSGTAYWIRYRVISLSGVVDLPTFQYGRLDQDKQYVLASSTQGQTQIDDSLGISDGTASQEFETSLDDFISGTLTPLVDDIEWTVVDDFLSSKPTEKHCTVEIGENDRASLVFGDGTTGKIPDSGAVIGAEYRYDATEDGNVGASTIEINKSGTKYINKIWNPRPAAGWAVAEGSTEASLEQAKIAGPASLRTGRVAIGPDDIITMTKDYVDADGAKPFSRASAFEEGYGPKTIELIVVAKGGEVASSAQLTALTEYFNGDKYASPLVEKRLVANQEVTAVNYTPKVINIVATVYGNVARATIESRLAAILQPEALKEDGVTWEWDFGGAVPVSRISHEIFEASENITKVTLATPGADVALTARELPALGTVTITISS